MKAVQIDVNELKALITYVGEHNKLKETAILSIGDIMAIFSCFQKVISNQQQIIEVFSDNFSAPITPSVKTMFEETSELIHLNNAFLASVLQRSIEVDK